jgi:hypothetical protein
VRRLHRAISIALMRPALRLALPALVAVAVATPAVAPAATSVKPSTGRFAGTHGFDGPISLTFAREDGIGLHLAKFSFTGTLKCDDGETIPYSFRNRMVTARTAARVTKGKFRHRAADIVITGKWSKSRTVTGEVTLRSSPCTKTMGFVAKLK